MDSHIQKKYEVEKRLGKGAYGIVWKVICLGQVNKQRIVGTGHFNNSSPFNISTG